MMLYAVKNKQGGVVEKDFPTYKAACERAAFLNKDHGGHPQFSPAQWEDFRPVIAEFAEAKWKRENP